MASSSRERWGEPCPLPPCRERRRGRPAIFLFALKEEESDERALPSERYALCHHVLEGLLVLERRRKLGTPRSDTGEEARALLSSFLFKKALPSSFLPCHLATCSLERGEPCPLPSSSRDGRRQPSALPSSSSESKRRTRKHCPLPLHSRKGKGISSA